MVIAQETASSRAAQAVTAGAGAERDQMRLAQRTAEAEAAQLKLAASQQSDARKTTEIAAADAAAARDKAKVAKGDARVSELRTAAQGAEREEDGSWHGRDRSAMCSYRHAAAGSCCPRVPPTWPSWPMIQAGPSAPGLSIEGYTDMSVVPMQRRAVRPAANAVMVALVDLGVPADRLSTRAHGAADPAATNATAAGRQMNRRVEIVFLPLSGELSMK